MYHVLRIVEIQQHVTHNVAVQQAGIPTSMRMTTVSHGTCASVALAAVPHVQGYRYIAASNMHTFYADERHTKYISTAEHHVFVQRRSLTLAVRALYYVTGTHEYGYC